MPPIAQIMCERIHPVGADVGIGFEIIGIVETGAGIAAFPKSMQEIMEKRVHARNENILVALQIGARVKKRVRLIAAAKANFEIMFHGAEAALPDVGILGQVPRRVEETAAD